MQVKKQLELDVEQQIGSKLRKEYVKAVYYHPAHLTYVQSSVQFSLSVVLDSLWPHEPQHTRPPCPSSTPGVYTNSCPLSWWCHPTISSSIVPFSWFQSFPTSRSFLMSQFFISDGQSIEASASASVLPMNIQDWFPYFIIIANGQTPVTGILMGKLKEHYKIIIINLNWLITDYYTATM